MDAKSKFDHVFYTKLAQRIATLGVDDNLIDKTQSFLTDQWIRLVIDEHINLKQKVETEIPQCYLVSFILFLVYISEVFIQIAPKLPKVTFLLIVDDLVF